MKEFLLFIDKNKEWLFDGLGVIILTSLVALITKIISTKKNKQLKNVENDKIIRKSDISLINDDVDHNYVIKIKDNEKSSSDGFSMMNIKLINKGNLDALFYRIIIKVTEYVIDKTPNYKFYMSFDDNKLYIDVLNNGWGSATDANFELVINKLPKLYIKKPEFFSRHINSIDSNKKIRIFEVSKDYFDFSKNSFIKIDICNFSEGSFVKVKYKCRDIINKEFSGADRCCSNSHQNIILTKNGFEENGFTIVNYCLAMPDTIYASYIDEMTNEKEYNISRVVASGGTDNFNIYMASNKSCSFKLIISLLYNNDYVISTSERTIKIINYANSTKFDRIIDGCEISCDNFEKRNYISDMNKYYGEKNDKINN